MRPREPRPAEVVIEPITSPVNVLRYGCLSPELDRNEHVTIATDFYCGGYPVPAAFDSTTSRAYYFAYIR